MYDDPEDGTDCMKAQASQIIFIRTNRELNMSHLLIVISPYYQHIAERLLTGAKQVLDDGGASFDVIEVPGALEIPPAIKRASSLKKYDAYVALGCVIRGETSHYDTVCAESARGLMDLGVRDGLAIGNGILTVENKSQATERADVTKGNKGGGAAEAALVLAKINVR